MSELTKIILLIVLTIVNVLALTKFKKYLVEDIDEYYLLDDNGQVIKKLTIEEAKQYNL